MTDDQEEGGDDTTPDPYAIIKQTLGHVPLAAKKGEGLNPPLRCMFFHFRKRPIDIDNLCGKAALDAIVRSGICPDDGPLEITEITHKQFKTKGKEETFIVLEEID